MARLGISMIATSSAEWIRFCRAAEAVGLAGAWSADSFARDSFVDAGLALTSTRTLPVGIAVALPTRTPLQAARAASSLAEWAGRFTVGFGVGHSDAEGAESLRFFDMVNAGAMESAHGIPFSPPLGRLRDYLDCFEGLLRAAPGEPVAVERTHFRTRGSGFGLDRKALPIVLGGFGPRICELSGEIADGLILHHIAPRRLVAARVELARQAHARSGSQGPPFLVGFGQIASVDRDERVALRRARGELLGAILLPQYLERVHAVDPELGDRLGALIRAERYREAADALPEELVRDVILVSTPSRFVADVEAIREVDLILPLPAGIFAPLAGDALGLAARDWAAARDGLVAGLFGSALKPA